MFLTNYFGVIPARGGSKGIPKKNIVDIAGLPLIGYTIDAAKKSKLSDNFIVSTDCEEIRNYSLSLDGKVPFLRPSDLAHDTSSMIDVLIHSLKWFKKNYNHYPENIVLLQPTSPFRNGYDIDLCIDHYEKLNAVSLVSVVEPHQHPMDMCYIKDGKFKRVNVFEDEVVNKGRQFYSKFWFIDGGIYIRNVNELLETREMFCESTKLVELDKDHGIDIDDEFTLKIARLLAQNNKK